MTEHLLCSHGRLDVLDRFRYNLQDTKSLVDGYMAREMYRDALKSLKKKVWRCRKRHAQPGHDSSLGRILQVSELQYGQEDETGPICALFYEHSPRLLSVLSVRKVLEVWRRTPFLNPARLLPGIIAVTRPPSAPSSASALASVALGSGKRDRAATMDSEDVDEEEYEEDAIDSGQLKEPLDVRRRACIAYLRIVCKSHQESSVPNTMVLLLAEQGDTSELISFLSAQLYNPGPHATLEPEFALRVCFEHKQYEAVVNIYQVSR